MTEAYNENWLRVGKIIQELEFKPVDSKDFPWVAEFDHRNYPALNIKFKETAEWLDDWIFADYIKKGGYAKDILEGKRKAFFLEINEDGPSKFHLAHEAAQCLSYSGFLKSSSIPVADDLMRAVFGDNWKEEYKNDAIVLMAIASIPDKNGLKKIEGFSQPPTKSIITELKQLGDSNNMGKNSGNSL